MPEPSFRPEDVPDDLMKRGRDALLRFVQTLAPLHLATYEERVRVVLAAVLPAHERQVGFKLASDAERAIRQVRRLHERYRFAGDDSTDYCTECNRGGNWVPYPCPTLQAIDAALRVEGASDA